MLFSPFQIEKRADGKLEKVPFDARTGLRYEKGTLLENLVTFDEALAACAKYNGNSVGRRFTEHDDIGYIDMGHCFGPSGEPSVWALGVVQVADSYTERSVSGDGIHVVGRFKKPRGPNKISGGHVEVYDSGQFMVLTDDIFGDNAKAGTIIRLSKVEAA